MVRGGVKIVQNGARRGSDLCKMVQRGAAKVQNGGRRSGSGVKWCKDGQQW